MDVKYVENKGDFGMNTNGHQSAVKYSGYSAANWNNHWKLGCIVRTDHNEQIWNYTINMFK